MLRLVRNAATKLQKCDFSTQSIPKPNTSPDTPYTGIFINNEWRKSKSGRTFETINPATGKVITEVQHGAKEDIDIAVDAAYDAFKLGSPWRTMDASERGRLLHKLADLVERDAEQLAALETVDNGKPFHEAYAFDVSGVIGSLRYMAGWADKNHGKTIPMDGPFFAYTRHEPVGVCGQIIPWNVPMVMLAWKVAPAIACMLPKTIFGPVQQLMRFKQLDEIIERANNTNYGLAAAVFSNDIDKVNYVVQGLKAGIVWVNNFLAFGPQAPFGGYKDSGHGREMSEYGLSQYTEVNNEILLTGTTAGREIAFRGLLTNTVIVSIKVSSGKKVFISKDIDKVNYVVQGLKAGTVWVNTYNTVNAQTPFGGFKDSGNGREMGGYGISQYTEVKTVITAVPQKNS